MPFRIVRNDITKMEVDAIVSPCNFDLKECGGINGQIYKKAKEEFVKACDKLNKCNVGEAKIVEAFNLPSQYVIFTNCPLWNDGMGNEIDFLKKCYLNCLKIAKEYKLEQIAFPLLSTGANKFPKDLALKTALKVIYEFLMHNEMDIYLVVFDNESFKISEKLFASIKQYIDDNHAFASLRENYTISRNYNMVFKCTSKLDDIENNLQDGFSVTLLKFIENKKLLPAEVYKRANIDRKLFSKIKNDINYRPAKVTVFAFAIALKLNLNETKTLLLSAGYALSHSYIFDIIIEYYIKKEIYDIYEINETLFYFNQSLLGV